MDQMLKQRLIGAIVIISLAVIFIPMILEGPDDELSPRTQDMPPPPTIDYQAEVDLPVPDESPEPAGSPAASVTEQEVSAIPEPAAPQAEAATSPAESDKNRYRNTGASSILIRLNVFGKFILLIPYCGLRFRH